MMIKKNIIKNKKIKIFIIFIASVVAFMLIAIGALSAIYKDKATPGTFLDGINISGMNKSEIADKVNSIYNDASFDLHTEDGAKRNVKYPELAIAVDPKAVADKVVVSRKNYNIFSRFLPFVKKNNDIPLIYEDNELQHSLNKIYSDEVYNTSQIKVKYDKKEKAFYAVQEKNGFIVDIGKVNDDIANSSITKTGEKIQIFFVEDKDGFDQEKANDAASALNKIKDIKLTYNNNNVFTIKKDKIASFSVITQNPDTEDYAISYDSKKIIKYLDEKVTPSVTVKSRKQIEVVKDNGSKYIVQVGKDGYQLKNTEGLATSIVDSIKSGSNKKIAVECEEEKFSTKTINSSGENWIEVDLSEQKTMLWCGEDLIITYIISSGKRETPTITGTFNVYYKTEMQTMRGEEPDGTKYETPDVPWATFFHGDFAFHGTYWHNNFGTRMSHGCLNMRIEEAKALYDFAPIGTKVVVHQ